MDWSPDTVDCPPDTPKTWPEWTDILGQTYRPGDMVAIAVINGKSPQMLICEVMQINRRDSHGNELVERRSYYEDCTADEPGATEINAWVPNPKWTSDPLLAPHYEEANRARPDTDP